MLLGYTYYICSCWVTESSFKSIFNECFNFCSQSLENSQINIIMYLWTKIPNVVPTPPLGTWEFAGCCVHWNNLFVCRIHLASSSIHLFPTSVCGIKGQRNHWNQTWCPSMSERASIANTRQCEVFVYLISRRMKMRWIDWHGSTAFIILSLKTAQIR
jgi:hypothetical protein